MLDAVSVFDSDTRAEMLDDIVVVGGSASLNGLGERLEEELKAMLPGMMAERVDVRVPEADELRHGCETATVSAFEELMSTSHHVTNRLCVQEIFVPVLCIVHMCKARRSMCLKYAHAWWSFSAMVEVFDQVQLMLSKSALFSRVSSTLRASKVSRPTYCIDGILILGHSSIAFTKYGD